MPYIQPENREGIDTAVNELVLQIAAGDNQRDGEMNYAITTLLLKEYGKSVDYKTINRMIGVLECIKLEMYRRLAAPYEDTKIEQNGDVY